MVAVNREQRLHSILPNADYFAFGYLRAVLIILIGNPRYPRYILRFQPQRMRSAVIFDALHNAARKTNIRFVNICLNNADTARNNRDYVVIVRALARDRVLADVACIAYVRAKLNGYAVRRYKAVRAAKGIFKGVKKSVQLTADVTVNQLARADFHSYTLGRYLKALARFTAYARGHVGKANRIISRVDRLGYNRAARVQQLVTDKRVPARLVIVPCLRVLSRAVVLKLAVVPHDYVLFYYAELNARVLRLNSVVAAAHAGNACSIVKPRFALRAAVGLHRQRNALASQRAARHCIRHMLATVIVIRYLGVVYDRRARVRVPCNRKLPRLDRKRAGDIGNFIIIRTETCNGYFVPARRAVLLVIRDEHRRAA